MFVLIAAAVLSWLLVFNVVNIRNPAVTTISNILYQLTEPLLKPIRRWVPNYGGLDLSFIVLWVFLLFITNVIIPSLIAAL
jgi:YggT family protein